MRLAVVIVLAVLVAGCLGAGGMGEVDHNESIESLTPATLSQGQQSAAESEARYVIQSQAEWEAFWPNISSSEPQEPDIDFSESTVIAAFMGTRSTGGYGVQIDEVHREDGIEVHVFHISPGEGCITTQALTSPYHVIEVPKIDGSVSFEVTENTRSCV